MISHQPGMYRNYQMPGVPRSLLAAPNGIKVSTHTFHTVFEPYETSLGTMDTLRAPWNSVAKETSFLASSRLL